MASQRDPLSVDYDAYVGQVCRLAVQRHRNHQRGPVVWIASPRREFRQLDRGGLTPHERAFQRSAYYLVFKAPRNAGAPVHYSLVMEWDKAVKAPAPRNQLARAVRVQLYRYGRAPKSSRTDGYAFQSTQGHRIDS